MTILEEIVRLLGVMKIQMRDIYLLFLMQIKLLILINAFI